MSHLEKLINLARGNRVARITYRKPQESVGSHRHVEPYRLLESAAGDVSVKCWQVMPSVTEWADSAWRCFRIDRILRVEATELPFSPRVPVTLGDGIVSPFAARGNTTMQRRVIARHLSKTETYCDLVQRCLMDGVLTNDELEVCGDAMLRLSDEQVRAAHARVYITVLQEITLDGRVTTEETDYLSKIRDFLGRLGWSP